MQYLLESKILPCVRLVGEMKYPEGWHRTSAHRSNVFLYMKSGKFEFDLNGRIITLSDGELILFPAGTKYRICACRPSSYVYLHFSPEESPLLAFSGKRPSEDNALLLPEKSAFEDAESRERLERRIDRCIRAFADSDEYREQRLSLALCELMLFVASSFSEQNAPAMPHSVGRMIKYINEHPHEAITLGSLSDMTGLSKQYIMRLFKTYTGDTVTHYINLSKLTYAQRLLRETDLTIEEIAYELGFCGGYYFCRLHKKFFGLTPSEYRAGEENEL